jgi:hypothetical protein
MTKYRRKTLIDAQQYKQGMEDGFACYNSISGNFQGYYGKAGPYPRPTRKVPYIDTQRGMIELAEGDYIVTDNGDKYPVKGDIFLLNYEKEV